MSSDQLNPNSAEPVIGDPRRQACASIRGYFYQIWISVHAWLELSGDEMLILEGAEDIDRIHSAGVETIQVKDLAAAVTLRSAAITDAISSYWLLREKNRGRRIRYRMLTTAPAGCEQGAPFGQGVKGLEHWEKAGRDPAAAKAIIAFLQGVEAIPITVRNQLASLTLPQAQSELFQPMVWELDARDASYVEAEVDRKLILLGEQFGILPDEARKATAHLLKHALQTACAEDRRMLDRAHLLENFQEVTTERVSRSELRILRKLEQQVADALLSPMLGQAGTMPVGQATWIQRSLPPLPPSVHLRKVLVRHCTLVLQDTGILILTGSVGMGKTTLAKLIASAAPWSWINLSGSKPEAVVQVLHALGRELDRDPALKNVLIDDVDLAPDACSRYESALGGLLITLKKRTGLVVLTSQRKPSPRFIRALAIQDGSINGVPPLIDVEIAELLALSGWPGSRLHCTQHATILSLQTSGHPQLVQAAINDLARRGWPAPDPEEILLTPDQVARERGDARQALLRQLTVPQKTLAYWIGTAGIIRRDHAVAIGAKCGVQAPGDIFDTLVGPWIEQVGNRYYRVSPLIAHAASDALPPEEVLAMHRGIAEALYACGNKSTHEAASILMHAFVGKHEWLLLRAVHGIAFAADNVRDALLNELSWFLAIDGAQGNSLYPENRHVNSALRLLQFRIAIAAEPSKAESIAEKWDTELPECAPRDLYLMERLFYVLHVLLFFHAPMRVKRLVACMREFIDLHRLLPDVQEHMRSLKPPPSLGSAVGDLSDPIPFFFGLILQRCNGTNFVVNLLDELNGSPEDFKARMISIITESPTHAPMLVDRAWLAESQAAEPAWERCLSDLVAIRAKSREMGIGSLASAAARGRAVILDEYMGDSDAAIAEIEDALRDTDVPGLMQDQRAKILYHRKDYATALEVWRTQVMSAGMSRVATGWAVWSYRNAGICAALTGDWAAAGSFFATGSDKAQEIDYPHTSTGLLADAAYSYWKVGDHDRYLSTIVAVLAQFDRLPPADADFATFSLGKRVGNITVWVKMLVKGEPNERFAEPFAGMCSDPEPNEQLRELPATVIEYCWVSAAETELTLGTGRRLYDATLARCDKSDRLTVQVSLRSLCVEHCAQYSEYQEAPLQAFLCARSLSLTKREKDSPKLSETRIVASDFTADLSAEEYDVVTMTLLALLICAASRGHVESALSAWKVAVETDRRLRPLGGFLSQACLCNSTDLVDGLQAMRDPAGGWVRQSAGALLVCLRPDATPEDVLQAHCFLLACVRINLIRDQAGVCLAGLVTANWERLVVYPVLFRMPMVHIPAIRRALAAPSGGIAKVAQIMLAVAPATRLRLPVEYMRDLEAIGSATQRSTQWTPSPGASTGGKSE